MYGGGLFKFRLVVFLVRCFFFDEVFRGALGPGGFVVSRWCWVIFRLAGFFVWLFFFNFGTFVDLVGFAGRVGFAHPTFAGAVFDVAIFAAKNAE